MNKLILLTLAERVKVDEKTNTLEFFRGEDKFNLRLVLDSGEEEGLLLTHVLTNDRYFGKLSIHDISKFGLENQMDTELLIKTMIEIVKGGNLHLEYQSYTQIKLTFIVGTNSFDQIVERQGKDFAVCKKDLSKRMEKVDRQLRALSKEDLSLDLLESLDEIKEKMAERMKLYDHISKNRLDSLWSHLSK